NLLFFDSDTPSACGGVVHFVFGGDDGDDLMRVECKVEVDQEDHWQRFLRFMHRYAESNGMAYGEPES
ncbi:MAG: hypothetical protein IGR76_14740, partial [Synechococcales cyanobacterium T60_A2020_003]|nr:hypothetical protein [Synechococcales cyanobacterium T60_A2020_003]